MMVIMLSGTYRLYEVSLEVFTLLNIGVISVMSPCALQSLAMLVTTLIGTRRLCKLSLDV
jgi:hypothetical protein